MFRSEYKEYKKFLLFSRIMLETERILRSTSLTPQETLFLEELKEKIRAFEHVQKYWLSGSGLLANYFKTSELPHPLKEEDIRFQVITQKKLNQESQEAIMHGALYAKLMAENLLDYLALKSHEFKSLIKPTLLENIKECAKKVQKNANAICAEVPYFNLYLNRPIYRFANLLGGRYLFSQQELDPISGGDDKGVCVGHVMSWKNEIVKTGKCLSLPRNDRDTLKYQITQKHAPFLKIKCKSIMEIWESIDKLVSKLDTNCVYELDYINKASGHAMGLRKVRTGEIEFFDPNYGLFVFPDNHSFRIWINELLSDYLSNEANGFDIALSKIGDQSNASVPSIPEYANSIDHENKYDCVTYQYNIKYDKAKKFIPLFKHLIRSMSDKKLTNVNNALDKHHIHFIYNNFPIKCKIIAEIDSEIKKIELHHDAKRQIKSLKELKTRLNRASSKLTLIGVIESWLSATLADSQETHETIIKTDNIPKTANNISLIRNLVSNYEINQDCMIALQVMVLARVLDIIKLQKGMKPDYSSYLFQDMANLFLSKNINTQKLIELLKKRCPHKQPGLFAAKIEQYDANIYSLYKSIRELNPDHPASLIKTSATLKKIVNRMEKDYLENSDLFNYEVKEPVLHKTR